jgi:hypothetical protein
MYMMLRVRLGSLGCGPWYVDQGYKAACLLRFLRLCSLVSGIPTQGCLFAWIPYIVFLHSLDQVDKAACLLELLSFCSLVSGPNTQCCLFSRIP